MTLGFTWGPFLYTNRWYYCSKTPFLIRNCGPSGAAWPRNLSILIDLRMLLPHPGSRKFDDTGVAPKFHGLYFLWYDCLFSVSSQFSYLQYKSWSRRNYEPFYQKRGASDVLFWRYSIDILQILNRLQLIALASKHYVPRCILSPSVPARLIDHLLLGVHSPGPGSSISNLGKPQENSSLTTGENEGHHLQAANTMSSHFKKFLCQGQLIEKALSCERHEHWARPLVCKHFLNSLTLS